MSEAAQKLRDNLGAGPYSRESAAQALGYTGVSGASSTKIAGCVHFGLLTRVNNAYSQSPLADQLFNFLTDEEKKQALKSALQTPSLYAKLIKEFDGKAVPKMLPNVLVRNHNIKEKVAKEAAAAFTKSAEYAGVLTNGVLNVGGVADGSADVQHLNDGDAQEHAAAKIPPSSEDKHLNRDQGGGDYLPVEIPNSGVKIMFPTKFAYDLSVGNFKTGIEELANNIASVTKVGDDDESDNPA